MSLTLNPSTALGVQVFLLGHKRLIKSDNGRDSNGANRGFVAEGYFQGAQPSRGAKRFGPTPDMRGCDAGKDLTEPIPGYKNLRFTFLIPRRWEARICIMTFRDAKWQCSRTGSGISISEVWPFATFAVLISLRDILYDLIISKWIEPQSYALIVALSITVLTAAILLASSRVALLTSKLTQPHVIWRVALLGALAAVIYLITFIMVARIGAGLFNLFDYGLTPCLTASLGVLLYRERWTRNMSISLIFFLAGVILLAQSALITNVWFIFLASISPLATAFSDALTKSLLNHPRHPLTRSELLFLRFAPASLILFNSNISIHLGVLNPKRLGLILCSAMVFGFVPLWLLCTGLARASLVRLASWEFLVPAISFFATLPKYSTANGRTAPIIGAFVVLSAVLVANPPFLLLTRFRRKSP